MFLVFIYILNSFYILILEISSIIFIISKKCTVKYLNLILCFVLVKYVLSYGSCWRTTELINH